MSTQRMSFCDTKISIYFEKSVRIVNFAINNLKIRV